jgi:hypothetical protein
MGNWTNEHRIQCQSCNAEIDVSVLLPEHYNATEHDNAIENESLNELLVDYGWLPTSQGCYCRHHAPQARARFRHCK